MAKENTKIETFISTVLILDKSDAAGLETHLNVLQDYLSSHYSDYEIIIMDQNNLIISEAEKSHILKNIPSIRWLKFAFPVEMGVALTAGIENAIGDVVILLRACVDPINIIDGMVKQCLQGNDVIVGVADQPKTLGYKLVRRWSNKLLLLINYHIPKNATPVRCLSRRAINTVLSTGQINHQFFIKVANTGYSTKNFPYKIVNSHTLKKRTLIFAIQQSLNLMIFNSTKPLRWMSILGVLGSLSAFLFAFYSILINFIKNDIVEGWTSMVFFTSFLFMILFIILAFLGEYMARLLNEGSNQRSYYISSEETSAVMLELDRFNVLDQS